MFSEALWLIPTWRPAAHSSFWSEWIPCFPSKTVCQCGVYTEVCWGYPSGIWRCVMAYLPPPPKFWSNNMPSKPISQWRCVTHTHTQKTALSKMPLSFPGITLNCDFMLAVLEVFGARWRSWWYKRFRVPNFHWQPFWPHFGTGVEPAF